MKAVRIHEYGDESVLRHEEVPDPVAGPGQVLVRIRAASLNRGDLSRRSGTGAMAVPLNGPLIIGWDIAGDVIAAGDGVAGFTPGQRVVGRVDQGGYAEMIAAPAEGLVAIPEGVSYEQAAALPVAYLTAWVALIETLKVQKGESVLVQACSSGVGMAGVQIAKHVLGATPVFTTAGSDDRAARGLALGADYATNYTTASFVDDVMLRTDGRGVDAALEMIGGSVFRDTQKALAQGGRLVSVGRSSGQAPEPDEALAAEKRQEVIVGWGLARVRTMAEAIQDLQTILALVKDGTLQVVLDRSFPLSETAAAHRHLASRGQFGKVLLIP